MRHAALFWLALLLLFGALAFFLGGGREPLSSAVPSSYDRPSAADGVQQAPPERTPTPPGVRELIGTPEDIGKKGGDKEQTAPRHAELRGRFVRSSGEPVADVPLSVRTQYKEGYYSVDTRGEDLWRETHTTSDTDGRFSVAFVPPVTAGITVVVEAKPVGLCPVQWSLEHLQPREVRDLGDLQLRQGGSIVGLLMDHQGRPLDGEWVVSALSAATDLSSGQQPSITHCTSNPITGEFQLENLLPVITQLRFGRSNVREFIGPTVDVLSGETSNVELVCLEANIGSTISVFITCPPYDRVARNIASVTAIGAGNTAHAKYPDSASRFYVLDNLSAGTYTIRIDDPRFQPWKQDDVEPGTLVEAQLKGSASVRLVVFDSDTGDPVTHYLLSIEPKELPGIEFMPFMKPEDPMMVSGLIQGFIPGRQTLIVGADGFADARVLVDLAPGEVRSMSVPLSRGGTVSGQVICPGTTVFDELITVRLVPQSLSGRSRRSSLLEDVGNQSGVRITSAASDSGSFVIPNVAFGTYLVQASTSPTVHSQIAEIEIGAEATEFRVDLILPAVSFLHGRAIGYDAEVMKGIKLHALPSSFPHVSGGVVGDLDWLRKMCVSFGSDGSYSIGPLPTEEVSLWLIVPNITLPGGFDGQSSTAGSRIELGRLKLVSGENDRNIDLRGIGPGMIRLAVTLSGQPSFGLVAELCSDQGRYLKTEAGTVTGREQYVMVGPVPSGNYILIIRPLDDNEWDWIAATSLKVISGEMTTFACDVPAPIEGYLKLRVTSEPSSVVTGMVFIRPDSAVPVYPVSFALDPQESVRLALPPGRYLVGYKPGGKSGRVDNYTAFNWPPEGTGMMEVGIAIR